MSSAETGQGLYHFVTRNTVRAAHAVADNGQTQSRRSNDLRDVVPVRPFIKMCLLRYPVGCPRVSRPQTIVAYQFSRKLRRLALQSTSRQLDRRDSAPVCLMCLPDGSIVSRRFSHRVLNARLLQPRLRDELESVERAGCRRFHFRGKAC